MIVLINAKSTYKNTQCDANMFRLFLLRENEFKKSYRLSTTDWGRNTGEPANVAPLTIPVQFHYTVSGKMVATVRNKQ